jgi:hypothetical protein
VLQLEETGSDRLGDALVDRLDRPEPFAHVERAEGDAVRGERWASRDGLRIDEDCVGRERGVDVVQGVHDALEGDASQRPAAECDVEPLARYIECFGVVDGEADTATLFARQCRPRGCDVLCVRVEGVHVRCARGGEHGESSFAAADFENALALERDQRGDCRRLDSLLVAPLHP